MLFWQQLQDKTDDKNIFKKNLSSITSTHKLYKLSIRNTDW